MTNARPEQTPAEEIRALLAELYDGVTTRESIPTYRRVKRGVKRGQAREVAVLDFRPHTTRAPGLLTQLGIVAAEGNVPGVVIVGAAVPQGSPGWDADGALSPLTAGGRLDAAEPVAEAWHVAAEVDADVSALVEELADQGRTGTLVEIALSDERTGRRIVSRLRGLVRQARIAAGYDAPIATLRDLCCPDCGGDLRVRADASSAVWCSGAWVIEGPAMPGEPSPVRVSCGSRWPRGGWVALLEDAAPPEPVEAVRNDLKRPAR